VDPVSDYRERAYELLEESLRFGDGEERIAVCESAVREADLCGDLQTQYIAREQCVRAYVFGGAPEKALVGFSWLLAQFDENPGEFSEWGILWKYKWMMGLICNFPQVPKARIYEMLDDLEARVLRGGYGLHAVYNHRYRIEKFWDNKEKAREYFQKMSELPVDDLSNCSACLRDEFVSFAIYFNMDERALELAQPLLDGEDKCGTVPHRTYAKLLLPMVRLGRQDEGLSFHRAGYRLIKNNRNFVDRVSQHMIFLTLTENLAHALVLFEKHYPWTEQNRDGFDLFHFFRASWLLFDMMAEPGQTALHLSLPGSLSQYSDDGHYTPNELADLFKQKADLLAKQFDLRNETDFFSRTLAETPALKDLCAPFPLGA
jgi:hypothetical protein